ncbi:MAG: hypothetical protein ACF8XB_13880 [Planctomycetota bacterium JB042]
MTAAVLVALPLLLLHAVATHGGWFAAIWLGLPAMVGVAAAADDPLGAVAPLAFAEAVHLGAVLAKGFVERTHARGAIPPFVVAHALLAAAVALPIALAAGGPDVGARVLVVAVAAGAFGLAYRLVSRRTEDDRRKCAWLLPVAVVLHLAVAAVA